MGEKKNLISSKRRIISEMRLQNIHFETKLCYQYCKLEGHITNVFYSFGKIYNLGKKPFETENDAISHKGLFNFNF
jgi:hypothetical protein